METSGGIQASLAGRYALALFDLARERGAIDSVCTSLSTLRQALADVPDLRTLVNSPVIARKVSGQAVAAVAAKLALDPLTANFLGVLAANRRLGQLPAMIRAFDTLVSAHKGETRAEVTSAFPLSDDQKNELATQLRARIGRDVALETRVDPAIMGGLVVQIGSTMIDSSIRTRLNSLAQAMRG